MKFGTKLAIFGGIYFFFWNLWATSHYWEGIAYFLGLAGGLLIGGLLMLAWNQEGNKQKSRIAYKEKEAEKMASRLGISKAEAHSMLNLGNSCPKCKGYDYYLQPFTVTQNITSVFATTSHTKHKNVRVCKSCEVEFVPRILLN